MYEISHFLFVYNYDLNSFVSYWLPLTLRRYKQLCVFQLKVIDNHLGFNDKQSKRKLISVYYRFFNAKNLLAAELFKGFNTSAACYRYAAKIKLLRHNCLWTDKYLAHEAGISDRTYRKAKTGDIHVTAETYKAIISALAIYLKYTNAQVEEIIIWCEKANTIPFL